MATERDPPPATQDGEPVTSILPFVLFCPSCHVQHIDEGEWETRPHRTHLCLACGFEWRVTVRGTRYINTVHATQPTPPAMPEDDVDSVWETVYLWQDRANKAEALLREAADALADHQDFLANGELSGITLEALQDEYDTLLPKLRDRGEKAGGE